jgi:putative redox protein
MIFCLPCKFNTKTILNGILFVNTSILYLSVNKANMTAEIIYTGSLRCEATHIQSGTQIQTDAPTDNKGKGEKFSPTDLLCVALATCAITTMGIKALDIDIDLTGSTIQLTKHMLSEPRRVGKIEVLITAKTTTELTEKDKTILERSAHACPVAKSLHPDVQQLLTITWP